MKYIIIMTLILGLQSYAKADEGKLEESGSVDTIENRVSNAMNETSTLEISSQDEFASVYIDGEISGMIDSTHKVKMKITSGKHEIQLIKKNLEGQIIVNKKINIFVPDGASQEYNLDKVENFKTLEERLEKQIIVLEEEAHKKTKEINNKIQSIRLKEEVSMIARETANAIIGCQVYGYDVTDIINWRQQHPQSSSEASENLLYQTSIYNKHVSDVLNKIRTIEIGTEKELGPFSRKDDSKTIVLNYQDEIPTSVKSLYVKANGSTVDYLEGFDQKQLSGYVAKYRALGLPSKEKNSYNSELASKLHCSKYYKSVVISIKTGIFFNL